MVNVTIYGIHMHTYGSVMGCTYMPYLPQPLAGILSAPNLGVVHPFFQQPLLQVCLVGVAQGLCRAGHIRRSKKIKTICYCCMVIDICIYIYMHTCMYMYTYIYIYMCTYMYVRNN